MTFRPVSTGATLPLEPPPETGPVRIGRMCPYMDTGLPRRLERLSHATRVAAMTTTCNIATAGKDHESRIVGLTFTKINIKINCLHHLLSTGQRGPFITNIAAD